jgi:Kef-type K+ transport system membrane component KefB
MEQIEFVGGVLLIPFFLLSTGMLIDPRRSPSARDRDRADLARRRVPGKLVGGCRLRLASLGLSAAGRLLFGLSLAQRGATLAAVTIGVDIGLFDTPC